MPALQPPQKVLKFKLPPGLAGVRQTMLVMRRLVIAGKQHPLIRFWAVQLTAGRPQKDFAGEVRDVFAFVRDGIRYLHDTTDTEVLHTAERVLQQRAGDCDDKVILLCAMLESLGHDTRLHAVGFRPGDLSHVYCDVKLGGRWVALDATEPAPMGWAPPEGLEHMLLECRECT